MYVARFVLFFFSSRGRHTRCALVTGVQTCALPILPTAPLILPLSDTAASCSPWRCRRATTLAISLPTVVGEAVWPRVRESIGSAACSCAIARSDSSRASSCAVSTHCRDGLSNRAQAGLFMSSLVQADGTKQPADG